MTISTEGQTVFVVDDDQQSRQSVCALVHSHGVNASAFASCEEFLEAFQGEPGCVVTDLRLEGMSGTDLVQALKDRKHETPVILITAYAQTRITVQAMKEGVITLLDKPYAQDELWEAIQSALHADVLRREREEQQTAILNRLKSLSPSEKDVLQLVIDGEPNKVIARRLDVSIRTVENRRREIYNKMAANSVAELVRMVMEIRDQCAGLLELELRPRESEEVEEADDAHPAENAS